MSTHRISRNLHYVTAIMAFVATFVFLQTPFPAAAFSVEPAIVEANVDPGSSQTIFIRVTNEEAQDKIYGFVVQKFIPKGESGQQEFLPPEETSGLPEWMFFDRNEIALKAGEAFNFPIGLRVPQDAQPGSHFAALFFSEKSRDSSGEGIATMSRTGILFLITVSGDAEPSLSIAEFTSDAESYKSLPVQFQTTITNTGGVYAAPEGEITITNVFGITSAKLIFNPDGGRALPNSSRSYPALWQKFASRPSDSFFGRVKNQLSNFALGPYTAKLSLAGEGSKGVKDGALKFSVWPTELMIVFVALLVLLVVLLMTFRRMVLRQAVSRAEKQEP